MKQAAIFAAVLVLAAAVSCGKLDVVGTDSVRAFNEILNIIAAAQSDSEWSINAPDTSARFFWNGESAGLMFDAQPFIAAGLRVTDLPDGILHVKDGLIYAQRHFQNATGGKTGPQEDYQRMVKTNRNAIGYHAELDHYGINLGGGNMFEFAKNINTNDKDIVFVLDPEPFIAAGTKPDGVAGWVFAKVTVDDANGKPVQVDKFLKPFNLK